ncbi:DeoR family transcriptional regulator [Micromonospora sp. NPDC005413]|uniref:DeoR family transcriptional regulator n=1 Tax=Micromonospora sp. NPDC005413 TaxID=3154563 RepID=UPI0033A20E74
MWVLARPADASPSGPRRALFPVTVVLNFGIPVGALNTLCCGCRERGVGLSAPGGIIGGWGEQGATRRSSPRRWRILSYLAQHGSASTLDVALVCAVSRLTAHRDLVWLHEAGLVRRERSGEDRTHSWWYGVTAEGD